MNKFTTQSEAQTQTASRQNCVCSSVARDRWQWGAVALAVLDKESCNTLGRAREGHLLFAPFPTWWKPRKKVPFLQEDAIKVTVVKISCNSLLPTRACVIHQPPLKSGSSHDSFHVEGPKNHTEVHDVALRERTSPLAHHHGSAVKDILRWMQSWSASTHQRDSNYLEILFLCYNLKEKCHSPPPLQAACQMFQSWKNTNCWASHLSSPSDSWISSLSCAKLERPCPLPDFYFEKWFLHQTPPGFLCWKSSSQKRRLADFYVGKVAPDETPPRFLCWISVSRMRRLLD